MTVAKQRAMNIISLMPEVEVEQFVSMNIHYERKESALDDRIIKTIDDDIDNTQNAIENGCEMLSVKESYDRLREKYAL